MNAQDATVPDAVARAAGAIATAIDAVAGRLEAGGRLVYVGAGTSGRLALVDAAECESTFAAPPGLVVAVIAGGAAQRGDGAGARRGRPRRGRAEMRRLGIGRPTRSSA